MSLRNIGYATNYFRDQMLTKLYGEPNYDVLNYPRNQVKANFTSVTSDLGRGNHGHLGLGLTMVQYNAISNTP